LLNNKREREENSDSLIIIPIGEKKIRKIDYVEMRRRKKNMTM
jgi:hypothetical protein